MTSPGPFASRETRRDLVVPHPAIAVAGRMMFGLIFFLSGMTHFTALRDYVALMPAAIPFVTMAGAALLITQLGVASPRRDP